jgi:hypothetical protein
MPSAFAGATSTATSILGTCPQLQLCLRWHGYSLLRHACMPAALSASSCSREAVLARGRAQGTPVVP